MHVYETISGFRFPLDRLDADEREVFDRLYRYARRNPEWNRFANRWWGEVQACYASRDLSPKQIAKQPLYQIVQDLEARLAIAQGKATAPDYRVELEALLKQKNITRYKLAQRTNVSQDMLSHVFKGRKNLSLECLTKMLDKLGYRITFIRKVGPKAVQEAVSVES